MGAAASAGYSTSTPHEPVSAPPASPRSLEPAPSGAERTEARRWGPAGILSLILAFGCSPDELKHEPDLGADADSGATDTGDSAGSDETLPGVVDNLSASVDEHMGSVIVLSWTQSGPADVHAVYSFDDGVRLSTPTRTFKAGDHRLLLLGVPFDTRVSWRLIANGAPVDGFATIQTGPLPEDAPTVDELSDDSDLWDAGTRWLLLSIAPDSGIHHAWTLIVDRRGRVVWAHETPEGRTTFAPRPSFDGAEILIDYNSWWSSFDGGADSQVMRLDIEGEDLGHWDTPGLIHPYTQLADGRLAWSAAQGASEDDGQVLVVQDDDGQPTTLFDCDAFSAGLGGDICAANAVWWNPADGHFLYSLYTLNTIFELDADGTPLRWFGALAGSWGFADPDTQFWWQHGAQYLSDGHLLLSARRDPTAEETVAREYALDEAHEQLDQVWSFGEGQGVYARILGEVRRLPNGDTLHNYGSANRIREVTADGEVVWEIHWGGGGTLGASWPLSDLYTFDDQ